MGPALLCSCARAAPLLLLPATPHSPTPPLRYEEAILGTDAVDTLTSVYTQFAGGGGAAKIDVNSVLGELQGLTAEYGNLFRLPPYFAYIARAFSVLEGIGLSADPDYAIVGECLPYISRRLMTDTSPRAAGALQTFVYGKDKALADRTVDADRLEYLADGLASYTASTNAAEALRGDDAAPQTDSAVVDDLLALLLPSVEERAAAADADAEGGAAAAAAHHREAITPLQSIVFDELAKLTGASARAAVRDARDSDVGLALAAALDPFKLLEPLARSPVWDVDAADARTLSAATALAAAVGPQVQAALDRFATLPSAQQREVAAELAEKLWKRRGGARRAGSEVVAGVARRAVGRLEARPGRAEV